jgi:hypothetical protein
MTLNPRSHVPEDAVNGTIDSFTALDQSGDKDSMNQLAQRLGKEQPSLLQFAAQIKGQHGDALGEAAVFYGTLMWAMFDRAHGRRVPRLLPANLTKADEIVKAALTDVPDIAEKPVQERIPPGLGVRQPAIVAKLQELVAEDVKEAALTAEGAQIILGPTLAIIEAFDAALTGVRPGQPLGPVVRDQPKVGRNEPCPCGSGKKWKRCHGGGAEAT